VNPSQSGRAEEGRKEEKEEKKEKYLPTDAKKINRTKAALKEMYIRRSNSLVLSAGINGYSVRVLLDSGATCNFIHPDVLDRLRCKPTVMRDPVVVSLGDGSQVETYQMAEGLQLEWKKGLGHRINCCVFPIRSYDLILGMPWLEEHNPDINWSQRELRLSIGRRILLVKAAEKQAGEQRLMKIELLTKRQLQRTLKKDKEAQLFLLFCGTSQSGSTMEGRQGTGQDLFSAEWLLREYSDVLRDLPDKLPPKRRVEHPIDTIPGAKEPHRAPYRMSQAELDELKRQLDELLRKGWISPSVSPYGAPCLFVKKKDGTLRLCVDYRALNEITVKDRFPLPRVDDLLDRLVGAKIFSHIDLRKGYHQFRVRECDRFKTAFVTRYGQFEWNVLPFGLCNAPATFSRGMHEVFRDLLDSFVVIFLDDILIFSRSLEEHEQHVRVVLERLRQHELYANPEKSKFFRSELVFLGHKVSADGIQVDESKTKAIQEWPIPQTVTEVKAFLGLASYYRKFVRNFSHIAAPLTNLTSVKKKFQWTPEAEAAFRRLKEALLSPPILQLPDPNKPFAVMTDASEYAIGAVLLQDQGQGVRPCAYLSRKLQSAERNYAAYERECLAIIHALKSWSIYLEGQHFTILTDHSSLQYLKSQSRLSKRQARWIEILQEHDYDIRHVKGSENIVADALSRRSDHQTLAALGVTVTEIDPDTKRLLAEGYVQDPYFEEILRALQQQPSQEHRLQRFALQEQLLYFVEDPEHPRLCVPKVADLRARILYDHHDAPAAGHPGRDKTYSLLSRSYFWPKMARDIERYVKSCATCQQSKARNSRLAGLLHPLPVPRTRWSTISMDFVFDLPLSPEGSDGIWVIIDSLSKQGHFIPVRKTDEAEDIAKLFMKKIFPLHGLPEVIISDRDPRFISDFWQQLQRTCGAKVKLSTAYHPQTDGQSERAIRTLMDTLRCFATYDQSNWEAALPLLEFAYNSSKHSATGYSPFYLTYGYEPRAIEWHHVKDQMTAVTDHSVRRFLEHLEAVSQQARERLLATQERHERYANQRRRAESFQPDQLVWLSTEHIRDDLNRLRPKKKLIPKWIGPYIIEEVLPHDVYRLRLPRTLARVHPVFHVSQLKRYHYGRRFDESDGSDSGDELSLDECDRPFIDPETGELVWHIERVLDKRTRYRRTEYLIKWKGLPTSKASWEPLKHLLPHGSQAIADFEQACDEEDDEDAVQSSGGAV